MPSCGVKFVVGIIVNYSISSNYKSLINIHVMSRVMMKDPEDILLIDLDNQGKYKIMTKDQIDKAMKRY